jgi:hypothetical protein
MAQPFLMSRKIRKSITDGINALRFEPFTERDVKALLIDLRELTKYVRSRLLSETNDFTDHFAEFIEICDFIAHASRNRGLVETIVRENIRAITASLGLTPSEFPNITFKRVLNANQFVGTLASVASFAMGSLPDPLKELHERQSDIALCILSILQDSIITLKDSEGLGVLQLLPYEGKYHLYCQVHQSKIEQEAKARTCGTGKISFGFPIMISTAECADPDILACNHESFPAPIFETYRDQNSHLHLRIVEAGGDSQEGKLGKLGSELE